MELEWRKIELFSVAIKAKFEMRHQNKSCHFPQNLPKNVLDIGDISLQKFNS